MAELGVCVIGAGALGTIHADNWRKVPDVRLISVADPDTERAQAAADKHGFNSWHASYEEALSAPGIHAVSVAVPSSLHRPCSVAAMDRGYHVICEKPIALTVADAEAMIAARDRNGVKLALGFCKRFMEQVEVVRSLVQGGRIGRPCVYRFITGWERRPKLWIMDKNWGGGPVIDLCCHYFDQWRIIFDSDPMRVKATGMTFSLGAEELPGVDPEIDTANLMVEHGSGDIGLISITWGLPRGVQRPSFEDLLGPHGAITVHGPGQVTLHTREGDKTFGDLDADMHPKQLAAFADAIRYDRPVAASAEDGLRALHVSLAALESIRTGGVVNVPALL